MDNGCIKSIGSIIHKGKKYKNDFLTIITMRGGLRIIMDYSLKIAVHYSTQFKKANNLNH